MVAALHIYTHPTWLRFLGFGSPCGVKMMSLCHGWGWQPHLKLLPASILVVQSVWSHWCAIHRHMVAALYIYPTLLGGVVHASVDPNVTRYPHLKVIFVPFFYTISSWCHESIHNNINNQQTPPSWWWSRSLLQRGGFNESTPSKWWTALRIYFLRSLLKGLVHFNKLM